MNKKFATSFILDKEVSANHSLMFETASETELIRKILPTFSAVVHLSSTGCHDLSKILWFLSLWAEKLQRYKSQRRWRIVRIIEEPWKKLHVQLSTSVFENRFIDEQEWKVQTKKTFGYASLPLFHPEGILWYFQGRSGQACHFFDVWRGQAAGHRSSFCEFHA